MKWPGWEISMAKVILLSTFAKSSFVVLELDLP